MNASAFPDPYFNLTSVLDSMHVFDVLQSKKSSMPAPVQPLQHGEATQLLFIYSNMYMYDDPVSNNTENVYGGDPNDIFPKYYAL